VVSLERPGRKTRSFSFAGERWPSRSALEHDCFELNRRGCLGHLAPLAGRGRIASAMPSIVRCNPGEGSHRAQLCSEFAKAAPHPNPLRASFARLDPAKSGAREK
jgi:hypothetical protein